MADLSPKSELKMWLAVRQDLNLSAGKMAGQSGHAFGRLYRQNMTVSNLEVRGRFELYLLDNEPKIVTKVASEAALLRVEEEAKKAGIPCELIRDAGRTEIETNTPTVCAFGPARREELPAFLKRLQLL